MPLHDFKCTSCDKMVQDIVVSMNCNEDERPRCCDGAMDVFYTVAPMMHMRDYELPNGGFKAYSMPRLENGDFPLITSRKQNREMMERNNLLDANDLGAPPTKAEQKATHEEVMESIQSITPTVKQKQQLKDDGILDIVA